MNPVPPRPLRTIQQSNAQPAAAKVFTVTTGKTRKTWKVGIYGPEGIGKSSLAALCKGATFADIEFSMKDIDCPKVTDGLITCWEDLRAWVQSLKDCRAGIDSMTKAEDWAAQYVIANKKSNEGAKATDSLEDFKYKVGLRFVNDEFKKLLSDIDAATRRGVSFIMTAHNCVKRFRDPEGADYIRHEPNLVDTNEVSNMRSWVQFLDVCAFLDFDKTVEKSKIKNFSGTRTIYLESDPRHVSKARGISVESIVFTEDSRELWERLGVK
jgi:AAA domain